MPLYNKYRPMKLSELVGHAFIKQSFHNCITKNNADEFPRSLLFIGPKGTGKTSLSRIYAKMLNCEKGVTTEPCLKCSYCTSIEKGTSMDVTEIDAATNSGVDNVRDIANSCNLASVEGFRWRVWIIDEAQQLSQQAWSAMLKTLEEPPPKTVFILCTTEHKKIPPTILSRCMKFEFKKFTSDEIFLNLKNICASEGVEFDEAALRLIAKNSKGGMRDALADLERAVMAAGVGKLTDKIAVQVTNSFTYELVLLLAETIFSGNFKDAMLITSGLEKANIQMSSLLESLIEQLHAIWTIKLTGNCSLIPFESDKHKSDLISVANKIQQPAKIAELIYGLSEAFKLLPFNPNPKYFMDAALFRAIASYKTISTN